jgi:hypothetical protein
MRSQFNISPFQGLSVSWRCHFIPLYGMLRYEALSGLSDYCPEGVIYANDGYSPSEANDGYSPSEANDGYSPSENQP